MVMTPIPRMMNDSCKRWARPEYEQIVHIEDKRMANKFIEWCWTVLIVRKIHIKHMMKAVNGTRNHNTIKAQRKNFGNFIWSQGSAISLPIVYQSEMKMSVYKNIYIHMLIVLFISKTWKEIVVNPFNILLLGPILQILITIWKIFCQIKEARPKKEVLNNVLHLIMTF